MVSLFVRMLSTLAHTIGVSLTLMLSLAAPARRMAPRFFAMS